MDRDKSLARRILEKAIHPDRVNDSWLYRCYLRMRFPEHCANKRKEQQFYADTIREVGGGLVFDVGANVGAKAVLFAKAADHVVCVEPSPAAAQSLRLRFARFKNITIVEQGVGAKSGTASLHLFEDAGAYNTFSSKWVASLDNSTEAERPPKKVGVVEAPVTTLDLLIERFGTPSYIKIDVEGFEIEVLRGLSKPVPLASIECNLPEFKTETIACLERWKQLQPKAAYNYCATEPPTRFASDRWMDINGMRDLVAGDNFKFMEIYMRGD